MTRAEEAAMKVFPVNKVPYYGLACSTVSERDANSDKRALYRMGYEQAEKDILSKITPEHIAGLKWIGNAGISSQPYPYHKYCKDLLKILEELLDNE